MPTLVITKPFKFAHQGIHVEEFLPGPDPQDLTDECAAVALAEGWARPKRGRPAGSTAAAVSSDAPADPSADVSTDIDPAASPADGAQADLVDGQ